MPLLIRRRKELMLIITSKKDGFRRCGIAHPARPTGYPDTAFSGVERALLRAEPMLEVAHVVEKHELESINGVTDGKETTGIAAGKKAEKAKGK
jgi:hypothetical protein